MMAVPAPARPTPVPAPQPEASLTKKQVREAATIKGALRHGKVVAWRRCPKVNFVLCGSVAVNLERGADRQGRWLLRPRVRAPDRRREDRRHTFVATTVHPIQILREHLRPPTHDLPVDLIATPRAVIDVERRSNAPAASSGTTSSRPRSTRSRSSSGWGTRERLSREAPSTTLVGQLLEEYFPFASPIGRSRTRPRRRALIPMATRTPEWLEVDWRPHLRQVEVEGARVNYVELGSGDRDPGRLRPRPLRLVAELAREHPPLRPRAPGSGPRPARVRPLADAGMGDLDRGLRAPAARLLRGAGGRATAPWSGTRWAASSRPRPRPPSPAGSRSSCWCPPPGSPTCGCAASPPRRRRGWRRPPPRSC